MRLNSHASCRSYEACTRTTSTWDKFEVGLALMCRYTHVRMLRNCRYIAVFTCSYTVYHSYTYIFTFYQESSITNAWKTTSSSSSSSITIWARVSLSYNLPTPFSRNIFNTQGTERRPQRTNPQIAMPCGRLLHSLHWRNDARMTVHTPGTAR